MKAIFLFISPALVTFASFCGAVTIGNDYLQLSLDADGLVQVEELESGTVWRQALPDGVTPYDVRNMSSEGNVITFDLETQPATRVLWTLIDGEPEVIVEIEAANPQSKMPSSIGYPYPFLPPSKAAELVIPNRSGALYPVTERVFGPKPWKVGGKELLMCWHGVVDERNASGMITVVDTPFDAELIFPYADELVAPAIQWLPIMGNFGTDRRMIFHFSSQGGYVPLAKYYRQYKMETGEFITLREKVARNPEVAKLVGGINARILHNNEGLSSGYLTRLPQFGIEKGSLCVRAKDDTEGIITDDIVDTLTQQGFLLTHWCTKKWVITETNNPLHPQYMEDPNLLITSEGRTFSKNELKGTGDDGAMRLICDSSTTERINQFIERCREGYPLKPVGFTSTGSLKIDTLCGDTYECYHPDHPQTREQSVRSRIEMLKDLKEKGFVLSSEGGDDWGVPYLDTAYGPLALERSQGRKIASATWGIKHPVDPKIGPQYDEYYFGPQHRVPLFDLVYHDCIVTTFHDGDSNNMYYKTPEEGRKYWRLKELFQILHGQAPNFYLTVDDFFEQQHPRIKQSIATVCSWHEKIAYDELVSHHYLTSDRMVQESRFSSGLCVVVNFNDNISHDSSYGKVEPLDFVIGEWTE